MFARSAAAMLFMVFLYSITASGQNSATEAAVDIGIDPDVMPRELSGFEGNIRGLWRDGRVFIGDLPIQGLLGRPLELVFAD